jgi:uncharacterized SAM-binding protein YcdF (DUF218 family)
MIVGSTDKELSKIRKIVYWTLFPMCLALVLVLVFSFNSVLTSIGSFLIVDQQPEKADVIIVLGGGYDRVPYGVKLYQSGYAEKVLLSGGNTLNNRIMKQKALSLGVPESAILQEDQSRTTFENAKYSLKIVQALGFKSAIVVTSSYHTRRSSIIYVIISAAPYDPAMTHRWWEDSFSTEFIASEYLKMGWHYLFEWN